MRALLAFMKKEWLEQLRAGRVMILSILFVLLGVMNPAVAKMTPWLMDMLSDSLAQSGMVITEVTVTAMDSWVQFFKNIPMGLIAFVLLESSIFTKEYESGTLILALTKGLDRRTVIIAKTGILAIFWTVCFWSCFGITYLYNDFYWDNSVAQHLLFSCVCWWLFGVLTLCIVVLFSAAARSNSTVLLGTGGVVFAVYLTELLPKCRKYLPTLLMDGNSLIYGLKEPADYTTAIVVTAATCIVCLAASIPMLNKRQL